MLDSLGSRQAISKYAAEIKSEHPLRFTIYEVEALLNLFKDVLGPRAEPKMERARFRDVLHNTFNMTDDTIMDRVFHAFDKENLGVITPDQWVLGMSVFLDGSIHERIAFSFRVYDMNNDGYISREEMIQLLKNSLVRQIADDEQDDGVKELVEVALKKLNPNHNNKISYEEFRDAVHKEPLLLEAFGPCFPDDKSRNAFLLKIYDPVRKQYEMLSHLQRTATD